MYGAPMKRSQLTVFKTNPAVRQSLRPLVYNSVSKKTRYMQEQVEESSKYGMSTRKNVTQNQKFSFIIFLFLIEKES